MKILGHVLVGPCFIYVNRSSINIYMCLSMINENFWLKSDYYNLQAVHINLVFTYQRLKKLICVMFMNVLN